MTSRTIQVGSRTVTISNADKVLFPDDHISEWDLANYYCRVAEVMLPHTTGRPISMQRFPNGIQQSGFYLKAAPDYFPDWIDCVEVDVLEEGNAQRQVMVNKPETLVYLADQACVTVHTWLSRKDNLYHPDKLIFDLDPSKGFETSRAAARSLRALLDEVGLVSYVMTTGSRGLHVGVPLDGEVDFDIARAFARDLADVLVAREPDQLTTETRKKARRGRLFIDYLRNAYAQTSVSPYTVRARPGAPVATPLEWDELDDASLTSQSFTIHNVIDRLKKKGDPWAEFYQHNQSLEAARERLDRLVTAS